MGRSQHKGRAGEREWATYLNNATGSQYTRTPASGNRKDIKGDLMPQPHSPPSVLDLFHHEVKNRRKLNIAAVMTETEAEVKNPQLIPYVAWRRGGGKWLVAMPGWAFARLLVKLKQAPSSRKPRGSH